MRMTGCRTDVRSRSRIIAALLTSLTALGCTTFDAGAADLAGSWTMTYRTERVTLESASSAPQTETCEATWTTTLNPAPDMGWIGLLPPQLTAECVLPDQQTEARALDATRVRAVLVDDGLYIWLPRDPLPGEDPVPAVLPPHAPNAELRSPGRFQGRLTVTSPDEPVQLTVSWVGIAE